MPLILSHLFAYSKLETYCSKLFTIKKGKEVLFIQT